MAIRERLLAWQWQNYADYHRQRANRVLHVLTAPIFVAASVSQPFRTDAHAGEARHRGRHVRC